LSLSTGNHEVLEWLDENRRRMYPLRPSSEVRVALKGTGEILFSPGPPAVTSRHPGGWLVSGGRELGIPGTQDFRAGTRFVTEVEAGDLLLLDATPPATFLQEFTLEVREVVNEQQLVALPDPATLVRGSRGPFRFRVLRRRLLQDQGRDGFDLEGLLLDACLLHLEPPQADVATLRSVGLDGAGTLTIEVSDQEPFVLVNATDPAVYPAYVRNARNSLLVVGETARRLAFPLAPQSAVFEPSVVHRLDGAWRGVTSLQFDDHAPLTGEVVVRSGWQVGLQAVPAARTLVVSAGRRHGQPLPCGPVLEDVPDDCGTAVATLNGARPSSNLGDLTLEGVGQVVVVPDPDNHRVFLGLNFGATDACTPPPPQPVLR
jgi:hypothetical protein